MRYTDWAPNYRAAVRHLRNRDRRLMAKRQPLTEQEQEDYSVIQQLHDYPLEPGQMLLLGPLSVAYITGDFIRAPWLFPKVKAPGGKMLPDLHVLNKDEWSENDEPRN